MVKKLLFLLLPFLMASSIPMTVRDAGSCSVPIFRYALERWKPDIYKGIYLYRGSIPERDQALLRKLDQACSDSDTPLNLRIREVNVGTFSGEKLKDLLKGPIPGRLPALAIWYPEQMGKTAPTWMLEFTPATVQGLVGSPKRQELAEGLIGGQSIIWVFVPSGNSQKDAAAKALIRRELDLSLKALEKAPFFTTAGMREKKLTYAFPILTVSRSDPQESFLLDMLMRSEPDLLEYPNEPMVFPVFGRGRVLGCLFGDYISKRKIQDAVSFLAASCSCEVKALNPGLDLLIPAQWDRVLLGELYADDEASIPELTGVMPGKPVAAKDEVAANPPVPGKKRSVLAFSGVVLSSAFVIVLFAGMFLSHRRKKN